MIVAVPHTCHPEWDATERQVRDWVVRIGLTTDSESERALARMGHGRMAGWTAPDADRSDLNLLAQWSAFIAFVDDGIDRDQAEPAQVRALLNQLIGVLEGVDAPGGHPAVAALKDLWPRTLTGAAPGWAARFVRLYRQFADATCIEVDLRASGEKPGLADYLALRRHTITALPTIALVERALPEHPALDDLRDATADIIAWANDIASAKRELAEGTENLVEVLAREHGCDLPEAAAKARAMLERRLDDFDATTGDPARITLLRRVRDGALAWQGETHRNAPGALPGHGERGITPLTRHLAVAVRGTGAVDDRCGSRVLESALLLALLRADDSHSRERERLTDFLLRRRPGADDIDALLIDACLSPRDTAARASERADALVPSMVNRGTAGRGRLKEVMLRTVLHLLCGTPLDHRDAPPAVPPDGITTFTDVHLLATRTIHAHACGRPHTVSDAERDRLVSLLRGDRNRLLWEASATTHLLGLHAVRTFRPKDRAVTDGLLRFTLALNDDGGMPFLDSQDLWLTAVAGLEYVHHPRLAPLTRRMAEFVAFWQAPDGGWPFATGMHQTDVDTTTRCMEFLHAAPGRYDTALADATRYLTTIADPGGGFPTWVRGDQPDLDVTAGAILALAPDQEHHHDLLTRAVDFVLDAQLPDGTFDRSWTVSESSAIQRVLDALHAVPGLAADDRVAEATRRAVARLLATQHPDGGWGHTEDEPSDVLSTAQTLSALARHDAREATLRAVAYLTAHQDDDGGFTSRPDQVGPRPLPFDYPVLADLHALTALRRAKTAVPAPAPRRRRFADLAESIHGMVLQPGDAAYEQARLLVNQRFDTVRPQAMVYPATPHDVVECVRYAQANRLPLALRSGGHSYAGYSTGPGLVLDVSSLNTTRVADGRARFGAGVKAGQAHSALAAAGAGLPLGRCPTVGLAGVTLGGGMSAFTRAWGLACDHLTSVGIVTADGRLRRVDAENDPDLFWALRGGGGGNFGVVTDLEFTTTDTRNLSFTTFLLSWPERDLPTLLRGWTAWHTDPATPREIRSVVELLSDRGSPAPPAVTGTFIGTPAELHPVLDRMIAAIGSPETQRILVPTGYVQATSEAERWGGGTWGARVAFAAKSHIARTPITPAAAHDLVGTVDKMPGCGGAGGLLIEALGGAVSDVAPTATAFPHRDAIGVVQYHSYWDQSTDPDHVDQRLTWLREVHATMQPHLGTGGYTNGMDPELTDWLIAYHGDNHHRLRQVKAVVDPDNFFTFPQSIPPDRR
ncbi:FAD-binding protein [Saccharothrix longispora]|uniref:FAD/FMN-containing dehydrogenase/glutathione S-transferase n=1 Tax=Saccharothrix longispora TaxID=33920 RepID=A0ABU1PV14_9PSEU|nr:FAD-binding protein [Saccharothrix longispora]MDR6594488.1 FAD/FMN-containing dehydrogenase/glutathione S-transferase [Saccharothrix longispora]